MPDHAGRRHRSPESQSRAVWLGQPIREEPVEIDGAPGDISSRSVQFTTRCARNDAVSAAPLGRQTISAWSPRSVRSVIRPEWTRNCPLARAASMRSATEAAMRWRCTSHKDCACTRKRRRSMTSRARSFASPDALHRPPFASSRRPRRPGTLPREEIGQARGEARAPSSASKPTAAASNQGVRRGIGLAGQCMDWALMAAPVTNTGPDRPSSDRCRSAPPPHPWAIRPRRRCPRDRRDTRTHAARRHPTRGGGWRVAGRQHRHRRREPPAIPEPDSRRSVGPRDRDDLPPRQRQPAGRGCPLPPPHQVPQISPYRRRGTKLPRPPNRRPDTASASRRKCSGWSEMPTSCRPGRSICGRTIRGIGKSGPMLGPPLDQKQPGGGGTMPRQVSVSNVPLNPAPTIAIVRCSITRLLLIHTNRIGLVSIKNGLST